MVDTISNMQLADINYKLYVGKSLRYIVDRAIGIRFHPPLESKHYKIIWLDRFHGYTNHQMQPHDKPEQNNEV